MKKIFAGLAIVTAMAACNSNNTNKEAEIQQARQYTIDSMKAAAALQEAEAKNTAASRTTTANRTSTRHSGTARTSTYRSYSEPATLPTAKTSTDRPGWSNKAKGAVIGGVVGAVTGAAVSKDKKGKGAIIGGVVGAAGGYGVGAILDKKKKE
jgi:hypothetical protein